MKPVNWAHFSWDLTKSLPARPSLPPSFSVRRSTPEDQDAVQSVVLSSFTLDADWNPFFREVRPLIESALKEVFHEKSDPLCLVLRHGSRIIGASGLSGDRDARNHLLTGPCLAMEYHNRGLASALLAHSLHLLRETGITFVRGATKEGSTAAQFIYPKFSSVRIPQPKQILPGKQPGESGLLQSPLR